MIGDLDVMTCVYSCQSVLPQLNSPVARAAGESGAMT